MGIPQCTEKGQELHRSYEIYFSRVVHYACLVFGKVEENLITLLEKWKFVRK